LLPSYVIFSCSGRLFFFKAITDTVTNLCFWKAKEENRGLEEEVLENKALKEHLAGMISQEKRRNTCF
jgi:hypothetical protein